MTRLALFGAACASLLVLGACQQQSPETEPAAVSRPVKTMLITAPKSGGVRNFPARIAASRRAELSFRVPGQVIEVPVKEGDQVEAEQVVAELDPKDFEVVVNDRQATYSNAKKNFDRAKELIDKGHISKMDYDRLEAEFINAEAALKSARLDLEYTRLKAPFAGVIAKRQVERFEEVQAKQPVLTLQDITSLDVEFDIPESIIRSIRAGDEGGRARDQVEIYASFEGMPGQRFPLTFKEISTKADAQTQTFEATYIMRQLEQGSVLPGMTAVVTVDLSRFVGADTLFNLPVGAVVGDYKLDPRVWVVDEQSMTVAPRAVQVGRMLGNSIEVTEGLEPGERIVTAGVPFLTEGMKVTLIPDREQAKPRAGEGVQ
jgi:RND family efflux transporter MFP subunit